MVKVSERNLNNQTNNKNKQNKTNRTKKIETNIIISKMYVSLPTKIVLKK